MSVLGTAVDAVVPRGGASALRVLLGKECGEQIVSARFIFGAVMSIVLCSLAATVRSQEYRRSHDEQAAFEARWLSGIEEQTQRDENVQVDGVRELSPLSLVSLGLEPLTPVRFTCTKEGLRFGEGRAAKTPTDALYGQLDLAFVVGTLLSLLAIMLTFDSITRERDQGTLSVVLSYPVRRPLLLAVKIAGAATSLALCLIPGLALAALISAAFGVPAGGVARWMAFAAASLLYLLVFATAGVLISSAVKHSAHAAIIAVFAWAIPVFAMPRIVSLVATELRPPTRQNRLALEEEALISQAKVQFAAAQTAAFRTYLASPNDNRAQEELAKSMRKAAVELKEKRAEVEGRLWGEMQREQNDRVAVTELLSYFTPTALFSAAAADLAGTGSLQRQLFYQSAHDYYAAFGAPMAESRHIVFARVPGATTDRALVQKGDLRPYMVRYSTSWVPSRAVNAALVPRLAGVAAFAAVCFVIACGALLHADVRRQ